MHQALAKILKKWRDVILEINRDSACSKPDNNKKDNKPDTKKKDNKPDNNKKDNKSDTEKTDNKPDTEKTDNKPDTSKNNIENRVINRIKYETQDIEKFRKILIKIIDERINILDLINFRLAELIADIDICENVGKFRRLCIANRIKRTWNMVIIANIYAVNVALKCLRNSVGNGVWPKDVSYNLITIINERSVKNHYNIITHEKKMLIKAAHEEIETIRRLIEINIHKYENIIKGAVEVDIYALDQGFADMDKTVGYLRKIVIMIPSIAEKKNENR